MPETGTQVPQSVAETKVANAVNNIEGLDDDLDKGTEAAVLVDSETMRQAEAVPVDPELQEERAENRKVEKQKVSVSGAIPELIQLLATKEFSKEQISEQMASLAEKFGQDTEKWMELTTFLETADGLFAGDFPQEKKLEVICALAEVVAEKNTVDGETIGAIAGRIEYYSDPSAMEGENNLLEAGDVAAGWTVDGEGNRHLVVFDKLFECNQSSIHHIIKHEVSHGLNKFGEIYSKEQKKQVRDHFNGEEVDLDATMQKVVSIIENAKDSKAGQSERVYKFLQAIEKLEKNGEQDPTYIKAKEAAGEKGLSFEKYLSMVKADAAEEIMAEQSAAYLESDGTFDDFIRTSLENRSPELFKSVGIESDDEKREFDLAIKQMREAKTPEDKNAAVNEMKGKWPKINEFMREKYTFYKGIDSKVKKPDFKETVVENIKSGAGQEPEEYYDDVDEGDRKDQEGQSAGDKSRGESFMSMAKELAKELADSASAEIEAASPIAEITKKGG